MELFTDVELTAEQEQLVGRAMLAVARADGSADLREIALIEKLAPIDVSAPSPAPAEVAAAFPEAAGRDLLLRSALLVAFVDGDYSAAERAVVVSFAEACSVPDSHLEDLASTVKDFLMAPLLPLSNSASVVEVSRKLKV